MTTTRIPVTQRPLSSTPLRRLRLSALVTAAALTVGLMGVAAPVAHAADPTNVAPGAGSPSASFTSAWTSLPSVENGVHTNSGDVPGTYWGTWSGSRPSSQWLEYTFDEPVVLNRSVISFWTDVEAGTGGGVAVPRSWTLQYLDPATNVLLDVPDPSGFGTSRTGTNETTFGAVTTTRIRATFQASPNAAGTSFSALGVGEWELWGAIAPTSTDDVIGVDETHVRTTPGVAPTLPATVRVTRLDGVVTQEPVTWAAVPAESLTAGAELMVAGTVTGVAAPAAATVWVRTDPGSPIVSTEDASALTTAGRAPALPAMVIAVHQDGSKDLTPVSWSALQPSDYAAEGVFTVAGSIAAAPAVPALVYVIVQPAVDNPKPDGDFTLATQGAADGADGWFRTPATVVVTPTDGTASSYEYRIGDGAWAPVTGTTFVIDRNGSSSVEVRDTVSLVSRSVTVAVDTAAPTVTASLTGRSVTVTAVDATSGIGTVEYRTDGGAWTAYTAPVVLDGAAHTVDHRATDVAGNTSAIGTENVPAAPVDGLQAVVTITPATPAAGWFTTPAIVTVALPAGATAAAGYRTQLSIDGAAWRTSPSSTTVSANGVHTVATRLIKSNAVVPGSDAELTVRIDRTAPTTSAVRTPAASGTPRNPVDLSVTATDAVSGVATVEYRVNSGAWTTAPDEPVRFATVGDYVIAYRATDAAGNVAAVKSTTLRITADVATAVIPSNSGRITAGTPVTLSLRGYQRFDTVAITAGPDTWATVLTDVNGTARVTYTVPAAQSKGALVVAAVGTDPAITAATTLTIR